MSVQDVWTALIDWVNNTTPVNETNLNAQLRDNLNVLRKAVEGDTSSQFAQQIKSGTNAARPAAGKAGRQYYATDDPKCVYLDDGTNWQVTGGDVPRVRVYKSGNQTITNDTAT